MIFFRLFAVCALFFLGSSTCLCAEPSISISPQMSKEGFLTVSWGSDVDSVPDQLLLIATDADLLQLVREVPLGLQQQVHLSGFVDGQYYVQLVDKTGAKLSSVESFEVQHRSLNIALQLFLAGAGLFILLLIVMFRFTR